MEYQRWQSINGQRIGNPGYEFLIQPTTKTAAEFVEKYGNHFVVRDSMVRGGFPFLELVNVHGVVIEVENIGGKIFVNGDLFAESWEDNGEESPSS